MNMTKAFNLIEEDFVNHPSIICACKKILNYIYNTKNPQTLHHLTFPFLSKLVNMDDNELMITINYLCGSRVPALTPEFSFIDETTDEEIDPSDINLARKEGIFYHPNTGEPVDDFENHIYIYFSCPSKFYNDLRKN